MSSVDLICVMLYDQLLFFFFNDTATTEIYTLSLHDALPILHVVTDPRIDTLSLAKLRALGAVVHVVESMSGQGWQGARRSEEHTSELQSRQYLVCRLLLEKKKHKT